MASERGEKLRFLGEAASVFGTKLPRYLSFRKAIAKSNKATPDQLEQLRSEELARVAAGAYGAIPYYRRLFDECGISPETIGGLDQWTRLPILTRADVRANTGMLKNSRFPPSKFRRVNTGGSSSGPLELYLEEGRSNVQEWAHMHDLWQRIGYEPYHKCAIMRGYGVPASTVSAPVSFRLLGRWVIVPQYNMTEQNLPQYDRLLRKFRPQFIQAYPSVVAIYANWLERKGMDGPRGLRGILCGSEALPPPTLDLLNRTLKVPILSWYGQTEQVILAGWCEHRKQYHAYPTYGHVEVVDDDGLPVNTGVVGRIVGTSYHNAVFPLLRYDTGDRGALASVDECECGRSFIRFETIEGRTTEYVLGRHGEVVSINALVFGAHFDAFARIVAFQVHQSRPGRLEFRVVPSPSWRDVDADEIRNTIARVAPDVFEVGVRLVDQVERTQSGKLKLLIQELDVQREAYSRLGSS